MASSKPSQTVAFFGATGGCTNACLVYTLKSGFKTVALGRTPSKLEAGLLKQGITQATLDSNLRIVHGDARDAEAVKKVLLLDEAPGLLVDGIVSRIGGRPQLPKGSIIPNFELDNPHVTEETTSAMIKSLEEILQQYPKAAKPWYLVISSTGLTNLLSTKDSKEPKDVPLVLRPLYHWALSVPHLDKLRMEELITSHRDLFSATVIVRASLLTGDGYVSADSEPGKEKRVKSGTSKKPAIGYTIDRAAAGKWIFNEIVEKGLVEERWNGEKVTLTF